MNNQMNHRFKRAVDCHKTRQVDFLAKKIQLVVMYINKMKKITTTRMKPYTLNPFDRVSFKSVVENFFLVCDNDGVH